MLENFPGLLWYNGIIAIHADWPIYPPGVGWKIALKTLGNFPRGTNFYEIDDIDRCKLLINQNPQNIAVPAASNYFHAAVWHEDLIELKKKGLIRGISAVSDYQFELYRFEKIKRAFTGDFEEDKMGNIIFYTRSNDGNLRELKHHKPVSSDEDEEYAYKDCAIIDETISLTPEGVEELTKLANEISLRPELLDLADPLVKISRFDTAIRDACLLIETKMKNFHNEPQLYGQKLIDFHIAQVIKNNRNFNSAGIKCYRGELRTILKFIRNEFAHNFRVLTQEQCKLILSRINDTLVEFDEVVKVYFNPKKCLE